MPNPLATRTAVAALKKELCHTGTNQNAKKAEMHT